MELLKSLLLLLPSASVVTTALLVPWMVLVAGAFSVVVEVSALLVTTAPMVLNTTLPIPALLEHTSPQLVVLPSLLALHATLVTTALEKLNSQLLVTVLLDTTAPWLALILLAPTKLVPTVSLLHLVT